MFDRETDRPRGYVSRIQSGPYARTSAATDVTVADDEVVVRVDLPGYDESDIEVAIVDEGLRIEAHPRETGGIEGRAVRRERPAGPVVRTVNLPSDVDPDGATAGYERGVLTVEIPRRSDAGSDSHVVASE